MNELSFERLREQTVKRTEEVFHELDSWSETDWACALAGEVGEACNLIKKLKRGDKTYFEKGQEKELNNEAIGKELADTVIYADLLAARLSINLGQIIKDKFNEVSKAKGSSVLL